MERLEQTPFRTRTALGRLLLLVDLNETIQLVHDHFEFLLAFLEVKVALDDRVFTGKAGEFVLVQVVHESRVDFTWELSQNISIRASKKKGRLQLTW